MSCSNCESLVTDLQKKIADYWLLAKNCKDPLLDQAWAEGLFGKKTVHDTYNKVNDFHYLLLYLVMIWHERQGDMNSDECGLDKGKEYYIDAYNIECIIKHFMCMGCNITNLLAIFDLFDLNPNTTETQDGIGFMSIYPSSGNCSSNEFQVA